MAFVAGYQPTGSPEGVRMWFGCRGNRILVRSNGGRPGLPEAVEIAEFGLDPAWVHYFGQWDGKGCYALWLGDEAEAPGGFEWVGLRELFGRLEEDLVWAAGRAAQLVHWHASHRFCGRCAAPTGDHPDERAKLCPRCGLVNHPRVTPAIIVAVVRDRRLLLAHAHRFTAKFFSVLAGFVEPGETLEQCVEREVFEEVGIRVRNIRYFGSQPWPFPDSLMVAFTADHAEGEIRIDPHEISEAGWYTADRLPPVPPRISVARRLIDWFEQTYPADGTPPT
jgi:NAD+ diphosphatase